MRKQNRKESHTDAAQFADVLVVADAAERGR